MSRAQLARQCGFSISEFMVASAIGMFLVTGLVGMYIAGKASYNTNEVMSRTQENARFSTDILTRYLRLADYRPDNEDERLALLPPLTDAVDGCIVGTDCGVGFAGNPDLGTGITLEPGSHAIHVKYTAPYDGLRDCTGAVVSKNDEVTATFAVGRADTAEPPSLYCGSSGSDPQPLVQGVSDLKIEYGIVTGAGNIRYTDHADDELPDTAEWPGVIALRVLVTVESGDETLATKAKEELEERPDQQFQATVQLRNRLL
jgi:type IV pilus assembly protein PilW